MQGEARGHPRFPGGGEAERSDAAKTLLRVAGWGDSCGEDCGNGRELLRLPAAVHGPRGLSRGPVSEASP